MSTGLVSRWVVAAMTLLTLLSVGQGLGSASPGLLPKQRTAVPSDSGRVLAWGNLRWLAPAPPEEASRDVVAIAGRETQALALTRDGRVIAWGRAASNGDFVPPDAQSAVTQIAASGEMSMALRADGRVVQWTCGVSCSGPTRVPDQAQSDVVSIAAGYNSAFAIRADGELVAWGTPSFLTIDADDLPAYYLLEGHSFGVPSEAKSNSVAVAAGVNHALALTSAGKAITWGANDRGQLAIPEEASEGVVAVAAGYYHSLALTSSGRVLAWGSNEYGQVAVPAEALVGVKAIAAGYTFSMALTEDGRVITWGGRDYPGPGSAPKSVQSGVMGIAAGDVYGLAIKARETVTAPGAVINLKATPAKGAIRVTWSRPADVGGATSVTYEHQVGKSTWKSTPARSMTIKGKKGVRITVKVRAVNEAGAGPSISVSGVPR